MAGARAVVQWKHFNARERERERELNNGAETLSLMGETHSNGPPEFRLFRVNPVTVYGSLSIYHNTYIIIIRMLPIHVYNCSSSTRLFRFKQLYIYISLSRLDLKHLRHGKAGELSRSISSNNNKSSSIWRIPNVNIHILYRVIKPSMLNKLLLLIRPNKGGRVRERKRFNKF